MHDGKEVGRMLYAVANNHLMIQMVNNHHPALYGLVGTNLFDYAFQLSIQYGKNGHIQLNPVVYS
jgi:hypothetical protein